MEDAIRFSHVNKGLYSARECIYLNSYHRKSVYTYMLYQLYKTFSSSTIMRHDCGNYIGKSYTQSENMHRSYRIFTANIL